METYLLLNDQPLSDAHDDLLGTSEIANGIASLLVASREASPLVLALDARWGMGKSTILRQVESKLASQPEIATVRFNAWTSQDENALEGLIKSVLGELDPNIVRRWVRRLSKRRSVVSITRISFALIARFVGVTRLVDELWNQLAVDARSRNELRDLIQGMLKDWVDSTRYRDKHRALVVFIDDLDRCTDEVVIKICEAVKLYLDAPGLIFVIACDLSIIARSVSASTHLEVSEGRAYLEKIAQVVHRLAPPDQNQLHKLIEGYAQQSETTELIDDTVTAILVEQADGNPRKIKRIINSVVLERKLNPAWEAAPLTSANLVTAVLLQLLYTPFYEVLVSDELGEDPIGEFLQYVDIRARAPYSLSQDEAWWSQVDQFFQKHDLPPPKRDSASTESLISEIEKLESGRLPKDFPTLARNNSFIALLRAVGNLQVRRALRAQLIRRPLGSQIVLPPFQSSAPIAPPGKVGDVYMLQLNVDGSPAPTYKVVDGILPDGLALSPSGTISGILTGPPGSYMAAIEARNSGGVITITVPMIVV